MKKALFLVLLYFVCQFVATLPFVLWHVVRGVPDAMSLTDPSELGASMVLAGAIAARWRCWRCRWDAFCRCFSAPAC